MTRDKKKTSWHVGGLHFGCGRCGRCCSGPGEGYIWVTRPEIELIAEFLEMTPGELRRLYTKRIGLRTTFIEHDITKDCIFLRKIEGAKKCAIYGVRPSQCRSWPFWPSNLTGPGEWNKAAKRTCPGINRGRLHPYEEIERIKKLRKWWQNKK